MHVSGILSSGGAEDDEIVAPLRLAQDLLGRPGAVRRVYVSALTKPEGVAVFWPAAGVSAGVLIALGTQARWPVVIGTMAATIAANILGDRNLWGAVLFALSNAAAAISNSHRGHL